MKKILFSCLIILFFVSARTDNGGKNFNAEAQWIFRVFACGEGKAPKGTASAIDQHYCRNFRTWAARYKEKYINRVRPFLARLRPANLPREVVYPFGGNDLASALATYPDASEVTTISLENSGDPRRIVNAETFKREKALNEFKKFISHILSFHDHSNADVRLFEKGLIPGQVTLSLVAASLYGYRPVSLRFFDITPMGKIRYLTSEDIQRLANSKAKRLHSNWSNPAFSKAFCHMELVLRQTKQGSGSREIIHRHFAYNLDNKHFKDSNLYHHLKRKGKVSVLVKGASYLLWFDSFSEIRKYLLNNMAFMYSDATGILPRHASNAGFEQLTFGEFYGAFLDNNGGANASSLRKFFKSQPYRPLTFRYGHADIRGAHHLIITRPRRGNKGD